MSKFFALAALFIGHAMSKRTVARIGLIGTPLGIVFILVWTESASVQIALCIVAVIAAVIAFMYAFIWCVINSE